METNSMKAISVSFLGKVFNDERGQVIVWMALGMVALLGMGGFTIDVGHAYLVRNQLQNAANAAALASVPDLFTTVNTTTAPSTTLTNDAMNYTGATSADANYNPTMGTVTATVTTPCLNALLPATTCGAVGNVPNAVIVKETAQVPTFFMRLFGIKTLNVGATATASPGGSTQPWNLAIVLDATPSMNTNDPNCGKKVTHEQCALNGIMNLLALVNPCRGSATNCNAGGNMASVRVSLFTFPNVLTTSVAADTCGSGSPTGAAYTLPPIPAAFTLTPANNPSLAGYTPIEYKGNISSTTKLWTGTYQVTPPSATPTTTDPDANGFSSDFFPGTKTELLNPNSLLVKAVGNEAQNNSSSTNGCLTEESNSYAGSGGPSGGNYGMTYFASAIYAAQAALQAEKAQADKLLPAGMPSTNAIVFISDGQANTPLSQFPSGAGSSVVETTGGLLSLNDSGASKGLYPSSHDPCQQAMIAGQYAASQGTRVFGIAYGSESGGCTDDTLATVPSYAKFNVALPSSASNITPCMTVENIADTYVSPTGQADFYAETSSVGCSVKSVNQPMNSLATIFEAILSSLGNGPRLVPNGIS
jgi:Flp pilus assembly protein TadG